MALAAVQHITGTEVANADSTSGTFGSSTGTGILVVVCVQGWTSGGFALGAGTVTDNKSATYSQAATGGAANGNENSFIYYAENVSGGASHQVTVNPPGSSSYFGFTATEVSGAATSSSLDKTAGANTGAGQGKSLTTGNLSGTTTQNDEIEFAVLALAATQASITVDVFSPVYTQIFEQLNASTEVGEYDYRILSATTNGGCSWTWPTDSRNSGCAATFLQASGGGGGPTNHFLSILGVGV